MGGGGASHVARHRLRSGRHAALLAVALSVVLAVGSSSAASALDRQSGVEDPEETALSAAGDWCVHAGAPTVAAPVIDDRGHVYLATTDGYVHSFSQEGSYRWSYTLPGGVNGPIVVRPADGRLWVGTTDRRIYAISSAGIVQWLFKTTAPVMTGLMELSNGGLLYAGGDRHLYAVSPQGGARWRAPLGAFADTEPVPGHENVVWVTAGQELLRVEGAWRLARLALPGTAVSKPLVVEGGVAVIAGRDLLFFDHEGNRRWTAPGAAKVAAAPQGELVVVSPEGRLRWLDSGGGPSSDAPEVDLAEAPVATPLVTAERVYVPLRSGRVAAVERASGDVTRRRLAHGPLRAAVLDKAEERLLAVTAGGRLCSVRVDQKFAPAKPQGSQGESAAGDGNAPHGPKVPNVAQAQ